MASKPSKVALAFVMLSCIQLNATQAQSFEITSPSQPFPSGESRYAVFSPPVELGQVWITEVEITGVTHPRPDDLHIRLASNVGANALLMLYRGGDIPATNVTLTFADGAVDVPADDGPLVSGRYRPFGLVKGGDEGLTGLSNSTPAESGFLLLVYDDVSGEVGGFESATIRGFGRPAGVPAVGEWGLVILVLTGIISGMILFKVRYGVGHQMSSLQN